MATRCGVRIVTVAVLWAAAFFLGAPPAGAQTLCQQQSCQDYVKADETIYRVCVPDWSCWNGGLVVFAHGYVDPNLDLQVPEYEVGGKDLSVLANQLGFIYATSSFPENGLAILSAIDDLAELRDDVVHTYYIEGPVFLAGASEGGAVTALTVERHPNLFSGGLALCGPVGSFQRQINHFGDFRVVFDYFFPGILPGTAIAPDPDGLVTTNWKSTYVPAIQQALQDNPGATAQLLRVMRVSYDPSDPEAIKAAVVDNLWYNVFATDDAQDKLGGQPFDNKYRFYTGSRNDFRLNLKVKRYRADESARLEIAANYETSGQLVDPVVTMHTTGDPIVPYWHEPLYRWKTLVSGSGRMHANLPVFRDGHCTFTEGEALLAFGLLAVKVGALP